jgi:hypothetical protein
VREQDRVAVGRSLRATISSSGVGRTITNLNSNRCLAATDTSKGSTVRQGPQNLSADPCSTTGVTGWEYYR